MTRIHPATADRYLAIAPTDARGRTRGYDPQLQREVMLHAVRVNEASRDRVLAQVQAAARVLHPSLVEIYDIEVRGEALVLVLEHVRGVGFDVWRSQPDRTTAAVVDALIQAGRALAAAHAAGVVHGRLDATSLAIGLDGRVKVSGLGLACVTSGSPEPSFANDREAFRALVRATVPRGPVRRRFLAILGRADDEWRSFETFVDALARAATPSGRRLLFVTAPAVLLAVAGAWVSSSLRRETERCNGSIEAVGSVWDDNAQQAIRAAISKHASSHGDDLWARAQGRLDGYVEAWMSEHRETCLATHVRHEQPLEELDLRMHCLRNARAGLLSVVDRLRNADAKVVSHVGDLLDGLPDLAICRDVDALRMGRPRSLGAEALVELERAHAAFVDARTSREVGNYDEARTRLTEVRPRLEAAGDRSLLVQWWTVWAELLVDLGRIPEAAEAARAAVRLGLQSRRSDLMLNAVHRATIIAALELESPQLTFVYEPLLLGVPATTASQRGDQAMGLGAVAAVRGDLALAEHRYEAAASAYDEAFGPGSVLAIKARSAALYQRFDTTEPAALEREYKDLIAQWEAEVGPDHIEVLEAREKLWTLWSGQGRCEEMLADGQQALARRERVLGSGHPSTAMTYQMLAWCLGELGRRDEARTAYERAEHILTRALGPDHTWTLDVRQRLAVSLAWSHGDHAQAEFMLRGVLRSYLRQPRARRGLRRSVMFDLGAVLDRMGRFTEAHHLFQAGLALTDDGSIITGEEGYAYSMVGLTGARLNMHPAQVLPYYALAMEQARLFGRPIDLAGAAYLAAQHLANYGARRGDVRTWVLRAQVESRDVPGPDGELVRRDIATLIHRLQLSRDL